MAQTLAGCETAAPAPTLIEVGKRSEENLRTAVALLGRLSQVADHLGGTVPTDGAGKCPAPSALSVVTALLRDAEDLATALYGLRCQVDRIERTVGVCFAPPDAEGPPIANGTPLGARLGSIPECEGKMPAPLHRGGLLSPSGRGGQVYGGASPLGPR